MRYFFTTLIFLSCIASACVAQTEDDAIPPNRQKQIDELIALIKNNQIAELADKVVYPIRRPLPLPSLKNKVEFIRYYPILIDSAFKTKLLNARFDYSNTIDRSSGFGLFHGDVWLNDEGKIIAINYSSSQEEQLRLDMESGSRKQMHPSVASWKENVLVCQTDRLIIRIDKTDSMGLRYASWSKPKTTSDAPDLILFKGVADYQGTMGGVNYSFINGEWSYEIDQIDMAESENEIGLYLRLYKIGKLQASYKCTKID